MDDWVVSRRVDESCHVGSLLEGDWPEGSTFAFEALSCPCVTCLSDVEGGGLLAGGQTRCSLTTWGSATSTSHALWASSDVGSPHRRWVTLLFSQRGKRGSSLGMCENGKRGDAICGFNVR